MSNKSSSLNTPQYFRNNPLDSTEFADIFIILECPQTVHSSLFATPRVLRKGVKSPVPILPAVLLLTQPHLWVWMLCELVYKGENCRWLKKS